MSDRRAGEPGAWASCVAALCGLLVIGALVLAPTLSAGFEFDDRADVLDNPAARPGTFLAALGTTNRPLTKASYALQRAVSGDDPRPFHAVNLALHLATALAVFCFVRRAAGGDRASQADLAAWIAAALWMLHPATVEAVAPVVGRSTLLSTLLVLGALLAVTGSAPPSRRAAVAAGALAAAASLARETALVLPALGLLWQVTIGGGEPRRSAWRRQAPLLCGTAAAAALIALSTRHRDLVEFSLRERSPLEALRGNLPALVDLIEIWLAPWRVSVDPPPPADLPWSSPALAATAALLLGAAALVATLRRRQPLAALAIGWTLLALAPSNSIIWRLDPVAPRALYPASIGLVVLVALAARAVATRLNALPARGWRLAAFAASLALLAWPLAAQARESRRRAALWADPVSLWADAAAKAPGRARPWLNLGVELMIAGRLDAAEAALERAAAADPAQPNVRCVLDALRVRRAGLTPMERSEFR